MAYDAHKRYGYAALDALPVDVQLDGGASVRIDHADISMDGYAIGYQPNGFTDRIDFFVADENNQRLDYNYTSFGSLGVMDLADGLMRTGGYWSEQYKDKTVPLVTEADLAKIHAIGIEQIFGETVLQWDLAVEVDVNN